MPTPAELIKSAHSTLGAVVEHLGVIEDAEKRRESAETQLEATTLELSAASKRLEAVKVELKKAEGDLQSKRHLINDEAARALAEVNRQITERQEEVRQLDKQIADRRAEHANIVAGLQALQQRIRV